MSLTLEPWHDVFAAQARGIDLSRPLSPGEVKSINAAMNEFAVLVWRNQSLTQAQQVAFASSFGPLDIGLKRVFQRPERLDRWFELAAKMQDRDPKSRTFGNFWWSWRKPSNPMPPCCSCVAPESARALRRNWQPAMATLIALIFWKDLRVTKMLKATEKPLAAGATLVCHGAALD